MIRLLVIAGAAMIMAGCAERSYGLPEGDASYDEIKRSADACKARGGHIQLKAGGDNTDLSDYECKMDKRS